MREISPKNCSTPEGTTTGCSKRKGRGRKGLFKVGILTRRVEERF
jgi:hypothetical protein